MAKGGHAWDMTRYGDTINERVVRILLECILVKKYFCCTVLARLSMLFDCVDVSNHILHQFKRTHICCINNKEINNSNSNKGTAKLIS